MRSKRLWSKMAVGTAMALMLAVAPTNMAMAAEMAEEGVIAAVAEDAALEDEIVLSGGEVVPETSEEDLPEEAVPYPKTSCVR